MDYAGLHQRYAEILGTATFASPREEVEKRIRDRVGKAFEGMMHALYRQDGAMLRVEVMQEPEVSDFISTHADALNSSMQQAPLSDGMRQRLERSNFIFSGFKAFHELNEAFPSLIGENGERKPFETFLNEVHAIDETYNAHYLRAEYNFVQASADMAAKWEQIQADGDRYNLQYRTAGDDKVRPEHAALNGVTLPPSDPFWESYYPPNGWNCRCTVAQVRKNKYPTTDPAEAYARGEEALQRDTKGIFRFNSGKQGKAMPDYNPYTIRRCRDCDIAQGKTNLAYIPDNELCAACRIVRQCYEGKTKKSERERIERNRKLYDQLSRDSRYINVEFNPETGALRATHRGHNTGNDTGFVLEHKLVDRLFECGHSIILCDEQKKGRDGNRLSSLDMILDGVRMDIKSITKDKYHYGSAIGKKNAQLVKFNLRTDVHDVADTLCMYFDDPTMFTPEKITRGYEYMAERTTGEIRLKHIVCIINSTKGLEIKTFDFP